SNDMYRCGVFFFFSSRRRHTRLVSDWSSDVCSSDLIVLFWKQRGDQEARKALVSHQLGWEVIRIVLVYRHRWTGTETFHRALLRSEERRVGKEGRYRWAQDD